MKMRIFSFIVLMSLLGCSRKDHFTDLKGPYLGQALPGDKAELFAPGIVSTGLHDRDFTMMPDGSEIIYCITENPHCVMVSMQREGDKWNKQKILPFSGHYDDVEPAISPDGLRLYFCSNRPLKGEGEPKDFDIWYVEKTIAGWGMPKNPGAPLNSDENEFYPSVTKDGTMYFTSTDMKIYRSQWVDGKYTTPEKLPGTINSPVAEYNAFIAPDESYLIFTSHGWEGGRAGRGDLFISFHQPDGSWSKAKSLGPDINSAVIDYCPYVTPDGRFLFFSSTREADVFDPEPILSYDEIEERSNFPQNGKHDLYWVTTSFIEKLKVSE